MGDVPLALGEPLEHWLPGELGQDEQQQQEDDERPDPQIEDAREDAALATLLAVGIVVGRPAFSRGMLGNSQRQRRTNAPQQEGNHDQEKDTPEHDQFFLSSLVSKVRNQFVGRVSRPVPRTVLTTPPC
jgi:hypothetical protein